MAFTQGWSEHRGIHTDLQVGRILRTSGTGESGSGEGLDVCVIESEGLGRVLFAGERPVRNADPFSAYHEMLVHVPMCSHPAPASALVLGGSDGATLEVLRSYTSLQSITMAGLSPAIMNAATEWFDGARAAFADPRLAVSRQDAASFVRDCKDRFDVLIFDPAEPLSSRAFAQSFFCDCFRMLSYDGVMVCDCGPASPVASLRETGSVIGKIRRLFPVFRLYQAPSRLGISSNRLFGFAGKTQDPARQAPTGRHAGEGANAAWYNDAVHRAAFAMPGIVDSLLEKV